MLFNNINISREDAAGDTIMTMKVPLTYGPKDKLLEKIRSDPGIQKPAAITLPRMSFEMTHLFYAGDRHLKKIGKVVVPGDDSNHMKLQYNPVPYDLAFSLYIYVKNSEDALKIVEQILPFFSPDYTVSAHMIPEMNITKDIVIVQNAATIQDVYEGDFITRRAIVWTLDFTLKGDIYGPVINKPVIKFVNTVSYIGSRADNDGPIERISVYPGLTANGTPTGNSEITVDFSEINFDDDYGYITVVEVQPFGNTYPFNRADEDE